MYCKFAQFDVPKLQRFALLQPPQFVLQFMSFTSLQIDQLKLNRTFPKLTLRAKSGLVTFAI